MKQKKLPSNQFDTAVATGLSSYFDEFYKKKEVNIDTISMFNSQTDSA